MFRFVFTAVITLIPVIASTLHAASDPVRDLALDAGGRLNGRLIDGRGRPLAGRPVVVKGRGQTLRVMTDSQGYWRTSRVRGGSYEFSVGNSSNFVRAWAPGTAPKQASSRSVLVSQPVHLQQGPPSLNGLSSQNWSRLQSGAVECSPGNGQGQGKGRGHGKGKGKGHQEHGNGKGHGHDCDPKTPN